MNGFVCAENDDNSVVNNDSMTFLCYESTRRCIYLIMESFSIYLHVLNIIEYVIMTVGTQMLDVYDTTFAKLIRTNCCMSR